MTLARLIVLALVAAWLTACAPTWQKVGMPDATFTGPSITADRFVSFDGAPLGLTTWPATDRDGAPTTPWAVIIGVHGMDDYATAFHLAAPIWAKEGVTTLAYDQRGFGRSPERGIWAPDVLRTKDLKTVVALARRRWPGAVIAVAGESMGGAVAIEAFASDDPPEADRLVLMAPAVWGWSTQPLLYRAALWLVTRADPGVTLKPPGWLTRRVYPTDNMDEIRLMAHDPLMVWGARSDTLYGLVSTMQHAQDQVGRVRAPMLYLYGAHDPIIPRSSTLKAVAKLPPTARTVYYPKGRHLLTRDLEGPVVSADILAFVRDPNAPLPSATPPIPVRRTGGGR